MKLSGLTDTLGLDKGMGELVCVLLPQFRGQGFMASVALLAIDFGLNTIGLNRVWAIKNKQNEKAIKRLEHIDFNKIADLDYNEMEYEL